MIISYYDKELERYLHLDIDKGVSEDTPAALPEADIDGVPTEKYATSPDGKYDYLCAFNYTLRDDMARRIRRKFYRKDNESGELVQMFTKWDMSDFQPCNYFFIKENVFFTVASYTDNVKNSVFICDISHSLDGENAKELWETEAYPYSIHLNPQKDKLAYHLAGYDKDFNPYGHYAINIMELDGTRHLVCSETGHLFFGPAWSPDGQWLTFVDCLPEQDRSHHFCDIVICKPDGSGFRRLTEGTSCLFATAFGLEGYRMGGSNFPIWTKDSKVICSPMLPNSHPDCHYDPTQRNHEELIYDPSMGRGGCGLSIIDPQSGKAEAITEAVEGSWDFRPRLSPDNKWLLYTHSEFGKAGEVRLRNMEDGTTRVITNGINGKGADHSTFVKF